MSQPYLGQINMFGGNFAQRGYAMCNGQILAIAQNDALFALIGTAYGGDGMSTFALPDLRSRLPVDFGQGPGLSNYVLGQAAGTESITLTSQTMPAHTHTLFATTGVANTNKIGTSVLPATPTANLAEFYSSSLQGKTPVTPFQLLPASVGTQGGSQPHNNMMPSVCLTFEIALEGIFPSRN